VATSDTIRPVARLAIGPTGPRWTTTVERNPALNKGGREATAGTAVRLGSPLVRVE